MKSYSSDPIRFLVDRKYPLYRSLKAATGVGNRIGGNLTADRAAEILREGRAYEKELKVMPIVTRVRLWESEQAWWR